MTTPTLELHISASGVGEVERLKDALRMLRGEVGNLQDIGRNVSALDRIGEEMKALRGDVQQATQGIKQALTEGLKGTFDAAAQLAKSGGKKVAESFDEGMKKVIDDVQKRNQEIAARLTELEGKMSAQGKAAGEKMADGLVAGMEKAGTKVRLAYSVMLGGGARASISTNGLNNLGVLMEEAKRVESDSAALSAAYDKAITKLEKDVAKVMQAATRAGSSSAMRGEGYIAWWDRVITDIEKGEAALAAEYAKTITTLDKQVAEVMKAATNPAGAMRGKGTGYKSFWNDVLDEIEAGEAKVLKEYEDSIKKLERQVADVMKAATHPAGAMRGKGTGYKTFWNDVLDQIEEGEAKVLKEYQDSIKKLETEVGLVMKAATQPAYQPAGAKWWTKIVDEMDEARNAIIKRQVQIATALASGPYSISEGAGVTRLGGVKAASSATVNPIDEIAKYAQHQSRIATGQASGPFSSLANGQVQNLNSMNSALRAFTMTANDAHSAARGLASGFGLLWLTWGQLLPLLAGAAISTAFVQTIKLGAEVNNTFAEMRALAGESVEATAALEAQMLSLSRNGPLGPSEVAKAMKTLALAGMDADKVGASIKEVMNFAVAGGVGVEKAADIMTTVAQAFNVSAQGYSYVGDTIAKAAAESKASVESMGEAFKTASVIHTQYGVSLKDTAVGLALLANAGIQGSAAGTALRNMYADLAGRSKKVEKALQELGINALDPVTGKMREQAEVFKELTEALSKRTPTAQFKYIQDIFSERGAKEAMAIMNALRQTAEDTGQSVGNAYEALAERIDEAAGFTVIAAAKMSLTPLNQMKSVVSSLQATLTESFSALEPAIYAISTRLKEAFGSDSFKDTLQQVLKLVGDLSVFFVDHVKAIANVVIAYAMFKGVVTILTTVTAATAAWAEITVAASTAVGAATRAATIMNPLLTVMLTLVTLVAGGWMMYKLNADAAKKSQDDLGGQSAKALLDKLQEEETRLLKVAEARSKNISLMQLEAQIALEKARTEKTPEMLQAETALNTNSRQIEKLESSEFRNTKPGETELNRLQAERVRLQGNLNAATEAHGQNLLEIERTTQHIKDLEAETARQEQERMKAGLVNPSGSLERLKAENTRSAPRTDEGMRTIEAELQIREKLFKSAYDNELHLLDNLHKNKLISEGTYQARSLQATAAYEQDERRTIEQSQQSMLAEYRQQVAEARRTVKPEALAQVLENLKDKYVTFTERTNAQLEVLTASANRRLIEQANNAAGAMKHLDEENTTYWQKASASAKKEADVAQTRRELANATDEVRARREAEIKVEDQHLVQLEKLRKELSDAEKATYDFNDAFSEGQPVTLEAIAAYEKMEGRVDKARQRLEEAKAALDALKGVMGDAAVDEVTNKKVQDLRNQAKRTADDLAKSMADGLLSGGKNGLKKLRDSIKEMFLSPIRVVLQGVMQPIANTMVNAGYSALGLNNAVGGAGSAAGSIGANALGTAAMGSAIGGSLSAGFSGAAAALQGGATFGVVGATSTTAAMIGTGGTGIAGALGSLGAGMSAALSAIPVVGWIALAGMALYKIFGNKGGGPKDQGGYDPTGMSGRLDYDKYGGNGKEISQTISDTYTNIATQLGLQNKKLDVAVQYAMDPKGTAKTQLDVITSSGYSRGGRLGNTENVARGEDALKEAILEETTRAVFDALSKNMDAGKLADYVHQFSAFNSTLEELNGALDVVNELAIFDRTVRSFGPVFASLTDASIESQKALVEMIGGSQNLATLLSSSFNDLFTEAERNDYVWKQLVKTFGDANVVLPATTAAYKDAVMEAIKHTDTVAGRETLATLLNNEKAFVQVYGAADKATDAITETANATETLAEKLQRLTSEAEAAQSKLDSAKDALRSYGQELQNNVDSIMASINSIRQKAAQNLQSAQSAVYGQLDAMRARVSSASAAVSAAADAYKAALQGVADAVRAAADRIKSAQLAIAQGYKEALDKQKALRQQIASTFTSAQDGAVAAIKTYNDLLKKQADALHAAGDSIKEMLDKLAGTGAESSSDLSTKRVASINTFDELAAKAMNNDPVAAAKVAQAGMDAITASRNSSGTRGEAMADELRIRQMMAQVLAKVGTTPASAAQDELTKAQEDATAALKAMSEAQQLLIRSGAGVVDSQGRIVDMNGKLLGVDADKLRSGQYVVDSYGRITTASGALVIATNDSAAAMSKQVADLGVEYDKATTDLAKWTSAMAAAGLRIDAATGNVVDASGAVLELADAATKALNEYNDASASAKALGEAIKAAGIDLTGTKTSIEAWQGAIDSARTAHQNLATAQGELAAANADLAAALKAAEEAGVSLEEYFKNDAKTPLDKFKESITALQEAQETFNAVHAELAESEKSLVDQYNEQTEKLVAANLALSNFASKVAGIDLSVFDRLSTLLYNYNAAKQDTSTAYNNLLGTESGAKVASAYQDLLGRAPELQGLTTWVGKVADGYTDEELRAGIRNSPEYASVATSQIQQLYQSVLGREADAGGLATYLEGFQKYGMTVDRAKELMMESPEYASIPHFASGGTHAGGWRLVGEQGPELEYTPPAHIFNAGQTAQMLGGGGNSDAVVAKIAELQAQNERMQDDMRRVYVELINQLQKGTTYFKKWDDNGLYTKTAP